MIDHIVSHQNNFRMTGNIKKISVYGRCHTCNLNLPKMIECMSKENSNHHMGMLILIYRSCRLMIYNWKEKIFWTRSVWSRNWFLRIFTIAREVILG